MDDDTGALPPRTDFSEWYNEVLWRAEIMDVRYPVKGLYVWYPFGFGIRKRTYALLRELLDRDHEETLFPLLIPEQEFMKEAEHIKGFEDEVYWVTHGGLSPLDVKLALRPTSETAIYPMYALWVRSHADLPLKLYQVVNTFRYETKHTRPLIRLREITSFKEAHTVHATWEEAAAQVEDAVARYREFYERLGIPVLVSRRPDWDKFPGADYTIAVDCVMPDGRTLQIGTVHHLGDHFSKTFSITYEDRDGEQRLAHQTCYGISERCIAALISRPRRRQGTHAASRGRAGAGGRGPDHRGQARRRGARRGPPPHGRPRGRRHPREARRPRSAAGSEVLPLGDAGCARAPRTRPARPRRRGCDGGAPDGRPEDHGPARIGRGRRARPPRVGHAGPRGAGDRSALGAGSDGRFHVRARRGARGWGRSRELVRTARPARTVSRRRPVAPSSASRSGPTSLSPARVPASPAGTSARPR